MDQETFAEIVKDHLSLIYGYLVHLTRDGTAAEDLAQETFIRAFKYIDRYDTKKPIKPWLISIARNAAFDYLRRKKVTPFSNLSLSDTLAVNETQADGLLPLQTAQQSETVDMVATTLANLPQKHEEILTLHYLDELSSTEIAAVLNLRHETVRTRLRRARTAFRTLYTKRSEPGGISSPVVLSTDPYATKQSPKEASPLTAQTSSS